MKLEIKHTAKSTKLSDTYYSSCIIGDGIQLIKVFYEKFWDGTSTANFGIISPYSNYNSNYLKEKIEEFNNNLLKMGFSKGGSYYEMKFKFLTYKDFENLLNIIKELLEEILL